MTSVLPASTPRSVASIASAQFESDEETFESDVLSRPAVTKKKSLHEAVKEKVSGLHTIIHIQWNLTIKTAYGMS